MGTALTTVEQKMAIVEQAASEVRPIFAVAGDAPTMPQVLAIAAAMDKMRKALDDDVLKHIKSLENSAVGFMTDKPEGYPSHVIKDVIIEAAMHGMLPVNNEINIIAGRFYPAKNGLKRRLKSFPGLTDLTITLGVPEVHEAGALVPIRASWKINGLKQELDCWDGAERIPVRRNKMMGIDGLLGKAERKMYARILDRVAGMTFSEEAESIESPIDVQPLPPPPAPVIDAQGEFLFSGLGDEKFLAKVQAADTLEIVSALREEYLAHCQCDEDRMFVVETCTARAHELRSGAASAPSTKE